MLNNSNTEPPEEQAIIFFVSRKTLYRDPYIFRLLDEQIKVHDAEKDYLKRLELLTGIEFVYNNNFVRVIAEKTPIFVIKVMDKHTLLVLVEEQTGYIVLDRNEELSFGESGHWWRLLDRGTI
jgi:hypothetical protein